MTRATETEHEDGRDDDEVVREDEVPASLDVQPEDPDYEGDESPEPID